MRYRFAPTILTLCTAGMLFHTAYLAHGGMIYRDKNGRVHLSDTPPVAGDATVMAPAKGNNASNEPGKSTPTAPSWTPVQLKLTTEPAAEPKQANVLFDMVNKSVWTVMAAPSTKALESRRNVTQGSAVAISENQLLTNCHVVLKQAYIIVKHAENTATATLSASDPVTDRCILAVEDQTLQPVGGYRKFETLTVGEPVYTIGSPQGLENTLGQGIISGLREANQHRFIQTTAQISPGSSGGGLFDPAGNLLGITTFKVRDSDSLNFAIAVEDFTKD